MTVLEVGPGMGFFSLPLARLVGKNGKVVCVDVQEKMTEKLKKRAEKAGLVDRIRTVLASEDSLRLDEYPGKIDFSLAFAVVHEVPDQNGLFAQINRTMKLGGVLLLSEPKGHVSNEEFEVTLGLAKANGFEVENSIDIKHSLSRILKKVSAAAQ
jgi:ubiquinone/menaquinone biosynthesis C-methylase UbiE